MLLMYHKMTSKNWKNILEFNKLKFNWNNKNLNKIQNIVKKSIQRKLEAQIKNNKQFNLKKENQNKRWKVTLIKNNKNKVTLVLNQISKNYDI